VGNFLAVSAFRDVGLDELVDAVIEYLGRHGVVATAEPGGRPTPRTADFFESVGRWTAVMWPQYFNVHDAEVCRTLSASMGTVTSSMSIYDDECWTHHLFDSGSLVDRFTTDPSTMMSILDTYEVVAARWSGSPEAVAALFGVPLSDIGKYYRHQEPVQDDDGEVWEEFLRPGIQINWGRRPGALTRLREFVGGLSRARGRQDPADPWGFVQLWERLGITYPEGTAATRLRLADGWDRQLPANMA
jgi:hypothetical protein